jgi:hypothetical protein
MLGGGIGSERLTTGSLLQARLASFISGGSVALKFDNVWFERPARGPDVYNAVPLFFE